MGSISRYSALERFEEAFGEKLESYYQYLVGLEIEKLSSIEVSYHVKGIVHLSNEDTFEVHHRWASEEEYHAGEELGEDCYKMEDYYNDHLIGKTIVAISVGVLDRDDEIYLVAFVDEDTCLEIPLGYDPENGEIGVWLEEILTKEEIEAFTNS